MDRESITFCGCALQGIAAAVYLGKEFWQWVRARRRGEMKPLIVHHPVWLVGLVAGCLLTAALGFWFVFHRPSATIASSQVSVPSAGVEPKNSPTVASSEAPKTAPLRPPKPKTVSREPALTHTPSAVPSSQPFAQEQSQQPTYEQKCEGSACAQGPGSQATLNQYGPHARHISPADERQWTACLAAHPGTLISIAGMSGDSESLDLANEWLSVFKKAGWHTPQYLAQIVASTHKRTGTNIYLHGSVSYADVVGSEVVKCLAGQTMDGGLNLQPSMDLPLGAVTIVVGFSQ